MSFTVGSSCSGSIKSNILTLTVTGAVPAGALHVVCIASDNNATTKTAGTQDDITSVVDSRGNTYTFAAGYANALLGASATAAHASIWYSVITNAISAGAGTTLTITWTSSSRARAAWANAFSTTTGTAISVAGTAGAAGDAGVDPVCTISSLPGSTEYLWVGCSADETTTAVTTATGFTLRGSATTSGGAANTNQTVSQFTVVDTGQTSKTFTPQTSTDAAGVLVAFKEVMPTADAWNVADKSATVALSNSDKTATASALGAVHSSTKYPSATTGKYYAEIVLGSLGGTNVLVGLQNSTLTVTDTAQGLFWQFPSATGPVYLNNSSIGTAGLTTTAGDVLCIAWDAGAEKAWFRINAGSWSNSGDPAAGTGSFDISALANTDCCLWYYAGTSGNAVTIRTELAEYTQTVPSGFKSWMGETPSTAKTIAAVAGSYALTGATASLKLGRLVTATAGAYALTGQPVTITKVVSYKLPADGGSYALTGVTAGLYRGREVLAVAGSYGLTGVVTSLEYGREAAAGVGSYALSGQTTSLELGKEVLALGGTYAMTGAAASLEFGREVLGLAGSYNLTGVAATLTKGAAIVHRTLPAVAGSYALTGGAGAATGPSSSLLTSYTPGTDRNDLTIEVGVHFDVTADTTFTWLGARKAAGNTLLTLNIWEWTVTGAKLVTGQVDFTGKAVGEWAWVQVPPFTLLSGTRYGLLRECTVSDGSMWPDQGPTTFTAPFSAVTAAYRWGGTIYSADVGKQYHGLDLGSGSAGGAGTSLLYGREVLGTSGSYSLTGTDATLTKAGGATIFVGLTAGVTDGVIGAGGSLPTGWTVIANTASSTLTVSGHGADDSVEYFDLQSTGGGELIIYFPSGDDGVASSAGNTWYASAYLKAIASTVDSGALGAVGLWSAAAETGGNYNHTAIATSGAYQASLRSATYTLEVSAPATIAATGVLDFQSTAAFTVRIAAKLELVSVGVLAQPGAYGLSGQPTNLEFGREVLALGGNYALSGVAASLELGREVLALPASYALTGVASSLELGREVLATGGSYVLSGAAATFRQTRRVTVVSGSYAMSGLPVNLLKTGAYAIIGLPGSYALTGAPAALSKTTLAAYSITASHGSYNLTGGPASLAITGPVSGIGWDSAVGSWDGQAGTWDGGILIPSGSGQRDGDAGERRKKRRGRIYTIIIEAAKKVVEKQSPLRKKRKRLAKIIAEEVLPEAGGLLTADKLLLELMIRRQLEQIPLTDLHTEAWYQLQDQLMQVITDAEQTAQRLRFESEEEDDLLLLLTS